MVKRFKSSIEVPGDKSISHRALMIAAISKGVTRIHNFLFSKDALSTMDCLIKLGVKIDVLHGDVLVYGGGLHSFKCYDGVLNAGNSGTTMRLLTGILGGCKFKSIIDGDSSLRRRPMDRIIKPLTLMGVKFTTKANNKFAPIYIEGDDLKSISYKMEVNSAQVKSSILFAGLYGDGETKIFERVKTRDHTERMLKFFGSKISFNKECICIKKGELKGDDIFIPGDISSASFFMALVAASYGTEILIKNVGVNETRIGIVDVLIQMGAEVSFLNVRELGFEKVCDIKVCGAKKLKPININGDIIPKLIDEIPIICVLCSLAEGVSVIEDIEELRYKESDRISSIVKEFRKLGINVVETERGIKIFGGGKIKSARVESYNDHRIAMSLTILSYLIGDKIEINNKECVDISFPTFYEKLREIFKS